MKRRYKKRAKSNFSKDLVNNFKAKLQERIVGLLTIVIISWVLGILNHIQDYYAIKKLKVDNKELKVDNKDLEWAVDYYRK